MPWCPDCKSEYRDGFSICSDCGASLVEEYPQEEPITKNNSIPLVLLKKTRDSFEADMIKSMLEADGIQTVEKCKGAGGCLKRCMETIITTVFGTGIYVSSEDYPRAQELIEAYFQNNEPVEENKNTEVKVIKAVKDKKKRWYLPDIFTIIHLCYWLIVIIVCNTKYSVLTNFLIGIVVSIFLFFYFIFFTPLIIIAGWYIYKLFRALIGQENNCDLYNVLLCIAINVSLILLVAPAYFDELTLITRL